MPLLVKSWRGFLINRIMIKTTSLKKYKYYKSKGLSVQLVTKEDLK